MTNDAEAQGEYATVTSSGHSQEPVNGDQAQRPDVLDGEVVDDEEIDDEEIIDPDAVIIEQASVVPADDVASPGPADDVASPGPADDVASPGPADDEASTRPADDEPGRHRVTSAPAATTIPDATRPGMPVGAGTPAGTAGTPAGTGTPARTDVPADTNMVGDPEQLHDQWAAIQSTFVDDPRGSVVAADELLSETIAALVASAKEREHGLRGEWDRDGVDTEGLRNALRSYRVLLDRLVRL